MRAFAVCVLAVSLVSACGGGDGEESRVVIEPPMPLQLPPPGGSRWAAVETDSDGDGLADYITRYEYDALGRPARQSTWGAVNGVVVGEALSARSFEYDELSRVLSETETSGGVQTQTKATYGADGLLASIERGLTGSPSKRRTAFTWQDRRIIEATVDLSPAVTVRVLYGDNGWIQRTEQPEAGPPGYLLVTTYRWRPDGQFAGTSTLEESAGRVVGVDLFFDADGALVRSLSSDEGFPEEMRRFAYDSRGRVQRVEWDSLPVSDEDVDFVADSVSKILWEDGLCQPVYSIKWLPGLRWNIAMQARPDGATAECAP